MLSIVLAGLAAMFAFLWWVTQPKAMSPPGPRSYPFVGNFFDVNFADFLGEMRRFRKEYGDVFSLMIGNKQLVVLCGYKANKTILIKHGHAVSDRSHNYLMDVDLEHKGILGSSGELWKEHRTFGLISLRKLGLGKSAHETKITEEVSYLLETIRKKNGEPFEFAKLMSASSANVICYLLLGKRYDHNDKQFIHLMDIITRYFVSGTQIAGLVGFFPWLRFLPGIRTWSNKYLALIDDVFQYLDKIIKEHKSEFNDNNISDFIDAYLAEQNKQKDDITSTFTDEQLKRILKDVFLAGTETTSSAVQWATVFFIQNPEAQRKMRNEIAEVVGDSRRPTLADKQSMPYCEAVVSEILRCGNVTPVALTREAKEDVPWGKFIIPKGATILPFLGSIQLDPEVFPEPTKFRPERFLTADGKYNSENDYTLPFGTGRRKCMGEALARMEIYLFITSLVQRFEFLPLCF